MRALFRAGASDGTGGVPVLGPDGKPMAPYNGPCDVHDVGEPWPQHNRIDVYFQAQVDGKKVSFLIEDKTDSRDHSGQLAKYLDSVSTDELKEDLIKPVYFKTGYVFSDEREDVEGNNYSLFGAEEMKSFLDGQDAAATRENEILRQYAEYLDDQIKTRAEAQANWDLNQDHVQWEFMLKLRDALREASGEWQRFVPDELSDFQDEWTRGGLGRGNSSGAPWTQYWFAKHLFWRLDSWKPRLRQMIYYSNVRMNVGESGGVVRGYRDHFNETLQEEGLCTGGVRMRIGNECTIGSVETTNFQGMEVNEFLDRVTRVHIRFLESISAGRHSDTSSRAVGCCRNSLVPARSGGSLARRHEVVVQ